MDITLINIAILVLLLVTAVTINQQQNLFAVVVLSGIYSLLCACFFLCLDSPDVAFTEAAVGCGIATVLFLATLAKTKFAKNKPVPFSVINCIIVVAMGGLLLYGLADMPAFGSADSPVAVYLADKYIHQSQQEIGVPNLVTAVLASYRGYDTLGEVTVIFTAGIGVLMLLGQSTNNKQK